MEWLMMNAYGANAFGENLGYFLDNSYIVADECADTLMEMLQQLQMEHPIRQQFRRQLASMEVMQKDLVPLLKNLQMEENANIFYLLMNVLMELTQPGDRLQEPYSAGEGDEARPFQKIQELSKLMYDTKSAFMEEDLIRKLFASISTLTQQAGALTEEQCRAVIHFFHLIRNLLYASENTPAAKLQEATRNHRLRLKNFLACGLGEIIIKLLNLPQWNLFCGGCVQVLFLMFKDQTYSCGNQNGRCASFCKDKESCEWPNRKHDRSLSADLGSGSPMTGASAIPELIGVIRCMEHLFSEKDMDTGSVPPNCKSVNFQKPMPPNYEDIHKCDSVLLEIRDHLTAFTMEFFQKGFTQMVLFLLNHNSLGTNSIDEMYFIWLVSHFLPIAQRKQVEFSCVRVVFLHEVLGMIIFEGLKTWTKIMQSDKITIGSQACMRLHLVVTALKEIFKCLDMYTGDPRLQEDEMLVLQMIKYDISMMKELRQFLVLSLRMYRPSDQQDLGLLSDLIRTNHLILQCLDECLHSGINPSFPMLNHVKQFGSKSIMCNYGMVLCNYDDNSPDMNTAILTMMHHVSGDCEKPYTLLQMNIISAFVKLCDSKCTMSVEVNDLIEYIFQIFVERMRSDLQGLVGDLFDSENTQETEFTEEEKDMVISLYMESVDGENLVESITQKLQQNGVGRPKTQQEVAEFLYTLGFQNPDSEIDFDQMIDGGPAKGGGDVSLDAFNESLMKHTAAKLREEGLGPALHWVQSSLMDVCYSKLILSGMKSSMENSSWEPLSFFCSATNEDIPLLQYDENQAAACQNNKFKSLLASMQFRLPCSSKDSFYIPVSWSVQELWSKAKLLGDINTAELKFSIEDMDSFLSRKKDMYTTVDSNSDSGVAEMSDSSDQNKVFWPAAVNRINRNLYRSGAGTRTGS